LKATGVIGIWPANSVGDDIEVLANEESNAPVCKFHGLRQQLDTCDATCVCQRDFVTPKGSISTMWPDDSDAFVCEPDSPDVWFMHMAQPDGTYLPMIWHDVGFPETLRRKALPLQPMPVRMVRKDGCSSHLQIMLQPMTDCRAIEEMLLSAVPEYYED